MTRDLTREEEEWLTAAVTGTASEEEKAAAAALLADEETRDAARAEEAFLKALKSGVSEGAEDVASPGAMGLQRLLRDIRAERNAGSGFSFASLPKAGRAFALAASLALAVITGFTAARITGEERSYRTAGLSEAGTLQVIFEPGATEGEIRALLLSHSLEIVEGPSALGVYRLVKRGAEAHALEELRAALAAKKTLVQSVEIE